MAMKVSAPQCPARPNESLEPNSEEHLEAMLDRALEATFPASDPIALTAPTRR